MARYKNTTVLKIIGAKIKSQRIKENLEIEDVSEMTGFTYNTITNIESGAETYFSYFIEVCFALGIHPKELMDIKLTVKPRFELSPSRMEKSRLTSRIKAYIQNGYFKTPRKTNEVVKKLKEDYKIDVESKNVSAIIGRFAKNNVLRITKIGKRNLYTNK
ncbi:helix-turn-helix domain-containing protein [Flavivirga jejuensis]|uniref:Helix-turn-helix transcriptional regulator n=1 Tax=Flavivirga jejuensis TaxID=870487 RepID=A0ABT8WTQ4_9FLAO|nr:helix-turn-helix transcriptional regulator [Flavivirga jejuensis]MDO5976271.1 helix-turn-helix transcriptional regulator [Flavivirga jejuensis]